MNKNLLSLIVLVFLLSATTHSFAKENDKAIQARHQIYKPMFGDAYAKYPSVPRGILEAIAFNYTRFYHLTETQEKSCVGVPQALTIMGLTDNGKGYFRSNLSLVAQLSGISKKDIIVSPGKSIEAYAAAYNQLLIEKNITSNKLEDQIAVLIELFELPESKSREQDFATNANLYSILWFLNNEVNQRKYNLPIRTIDLENVFGKNNLDILSSKKVIISNENITTESGLMYKSQKALGCLDYPTAIWDEADSSNFSSRYGTAISAFTIHDIQGTYAAAISWFKNPAANASTQYVIRNFDGQITQMVCEADKAWHVTSSNPFTVGTEHEGYWDVPGWYTEAMYQASASVVGNTFDNNGLDKKRAYDGPAHSGLLQLSSCYKVKGHQHYPSQTHTDPGIYWDWGYFYELLNPTFTINTTYSNVSGNFYDDGGVLGNYLEDDRTFWLIQPTGASSVTLDFTLFELENNFDFLYIYDGSSNNDPLIGRYTNTDSPGTITGNSGALLVEFRSDCNTTLAGWEANWTSNMTPATCGTPTNVISSNETAFTTDLTWNAITGANGYSIRYRHQMNDTLWTYVYSASNNYTITSLAANGQHEAHVAAICGTDTSAYAGVNFTTAIPQGQVTTTACSGTFRDAGGNINYSNNENYLFTIAPTGVTNVSVVFDWFDTELNYDYLYVYNGLTDSDPSLGTFNGTSNPGTVTSTNGSLTFKFDSDNSTVSSGWEAKWYAYGGNCPTVPVTVIDSINTWNTADFTASFSDTDNSSTSINDQYYQVVDFNGTRWESNTDNGYLFDDFTNGMSPDWVNYNGTWNVSGGVLIQSNEANVNTNLYIPLEQDSLHSYLYAWKMKIEGTSSSKRAGVHIFSDAPTGVERGSSYLAWIRTDANTVQLWDNVNNADTRLTDEVYTTNIGNWADYKLIYNPQNGKQSLYIDNVLVSTYTDNTPHKTGQYLSLRTRYCTGSFDDIEVYKSRNNSTIVNVGAASINDIRYQNQNPNSPSGRINSIVRDNNEHISNEYSQNQNIDWTAPVDIATINDGIAADIDTAYTSIEANWTVSSDLNSDIKSYWYAVGTTQGDTDIINWTDNGNVNSFSIINSGQFSYNQVYYVSVKAENNAGLFSNTINSDGQILIQQQTVQANFTASTTTLCSGDSISFMNSSIGATDYSWSFTGASTSASTDVNSTVEFTTAGTQTVTLTATDGTNSDTYSITVVVNATPIQPIITASGSGNLCGADSVELSTGIYSSYTWSTGDTGASIWASTSGGYSVEVNSLDGCVNNSDTMYINLSAIVSPEICIVGIDSTNNSTQVIWNKPLNNAIDSFYIYRETNVANQYDFIAAVDYNDLSVYSDTSANPEQQAYRYKLAAKDTCGGVSLPGDFHKTIHLTINQGMGTTWNLIWNHYEGFNFGSYDIYRGADPNNLTLLTTIASSLDSFTDLTPPIGIVYYQIEIVNPSGCNPTKSMSSSKSNVASNGVSAIGSNNSLENITMFPNPSTGNLNLQIDLKTETVITIEIYNTIGQIVYDNKELVLGDKTISMDISSIAKGAYYVQVKTTTERWIQQLIKE